jgi:putative phosphoesterase
MRIGILSDTHDHLDAMKAGMKILRENRAEMFIHCGDVGGEQILDCLAGEKSVFVWGNCDMDRVNLARYAKEIGIDCAGDFADLELAGKRIAVTHGHDASLMRSTMAGERFDYLLYGHTHIPADDRNGKLRMINPGALYRAATKTVAILDLTTDILERFTVNI